MCVGGNRRWVPLIYQCFRIQEKTVRCSSHRMFSCNSWSCRNQAPSSWSKTVGEGPTAADREEKEQNEFLAGRDACASADQYIAENAESLSGKVDFSTDVETAQKDYGVNTKDSYRSNRTKRKPKTEKKATQKLFRIRNTYDTLQGKLMRLQWISWNVTAQWTYSRLKFLTQWVTWRM